MVTIIDKIIQKLFDSLLHKYQIDLEQSMKGSNFITDYFSGMFYICNKMSFNRGGSYIDCPKWIKSKRKQYLQKIIMTWRRKFMFARKRLAKVLDKQQINWLYVIILCTSFRVNLHSIVCLNARKLFTWSRCHIWNLSVGSKIHTSKCTVQGSTHNTAQSFGQFG